VLQKVGTGRINKQMEIVCSVASEASSCGLLGHCGLYKAVVDVRWGLIRESIH
jgi:hypothetical protein